MQITVPYVDLISFSSYKYYSYPDWVIQALPDEDSPKKRKATILVCNSSMQVQLCNAAG